MDFPYLFFLWHAGHKIFICRYKTKKANHVSEFGQAIGIVGMSQVDPSTIFSKELSGQWMLAHRHNSRS